MCPLSYICCFSESLATCPPHDAHLHFPMVDLSICFCLATLLLADASSGSKEPLPSDNMASVLACDEEIVNARCGAVSRSLRQVLPCLSGDVQSLHASVASKETDSGKPSIVGSTTFTTASWDPMVPHSGRIGLRFMIKLLEGLTLAGPGRWLVWLGLHSARAAKQIPRGLPVMQPHSCRY